MPNGSTALFSVSGNIIVGTDVGEPAYDATCIAPTTQDGYSSDIQSDIPSSCSIEGTYSADKYFVIDGHNDCSTDTDKKLNIAGNVIANAGLTGGTFVNRRDLCAGNYCPVFTLTNRTDFILNSPSFIRKNNYTWQETAP